jgi:predicted TIM-barrel fold metal-dependent hydrolase
MATGKWVSEPLRPAASLTAPSFDMPPSACDCHMHVFGPADAYPGIPDAKYTKPEGDLAQYRAVAQRLGIARMVFVQASFYGTDNRCILDAMAASGERARGVVFLPDHPSSGLLDDWHRRGVRGVRLDLFRATMQQASLQDVLDRIRDAQAVAKPLGWHLEFYAPGLWVRDLVPHLETLDIEWCVNHMGYMTAEEGLTDADFDRFVALVRQRGWVKLTGPYRVAHDGPNDRPDAMARALVEAAPGRMLWGTDWPHLPKGGRDTGALLNRLQLWCPDPELRRRILVDNPARLYGFG